MPSPLRSKFFTLSAFLLFSFILSFSNSSAAEKYDEKSIECSSTLFGTLSQADCEKNCPQDPKGGGVQTEYKCFESPTADGCFTCARDQYCADLGYISAWDCAICDANPLTECVNAGTAIPFGGPTLGGKTWSGVQCYKCQAKPDRCNQRWPGTSWLAACQANCLAPDTCVMAGIHEGNACFKCQKAPKDCKAMGFMTAAQCNACNANPKTHCIFAGLDEKFQQCFQCVPRNVPPPPPPPPKTCRDLGFLDNCNPCLREGKGCNQIAINPNLLCAECTEPSTVKRCEPPSLNAEDCADCVRRGGQCMPKTQVRGEPPCYTCYMPPTPKTGCAKHAMFNGCSPNPCSPSEECTIVQPEPNLSCGVCVYKEGPLDTTCEERRMLPDCATCYRASMACRQVFVPEKNMYCARCYTPDDNRQCGDGEWPGACTESSCPSGQECFDTNENCHRCEGKGKCTDIGYLNCDKDCAACEKEPTRVCRQTGISKDDGGCCECVIRPVRDDCPQGSMGGLCPGSCTSQQECKNVGHRCHSCLNKDDKCEKYGAHSSCWPTPCNPETEVCDTLRPDPKPGLYCNTCKPKADWCKEYGNYFPSCTPDPCQPGERCEMTGVTMSSVECAKCISKAEDENMCEEFGYIDGNCTGSSCSGGMECREANIYSNKCHKCECGYGSSQGACAPDSCGEGEYGKCIETVPGKCHRCDNAGTCSDNSMFTLERCQEQCESGGQYKCMPTGVTKSDGPCYDCVPRTTEDCKNQDAIPGNCPGGCNSQQECRNIDNYCHVCLNKDETCEKYGALSSCQQNSCNQETEVCDSLRPGPKPGLYCYGCKPKAEWCSEYGKYHASCDPNPCQKGERCVMTGVTMSSVECAKCISKEEDEKMCEEYGYSDGPCGSSSCSNGLECRETNIHGNKCHKCECDHGTYQGSCATDPCAGAEPPETCVETVPGKCFRCDSAGTCRDNGLIPCGAECRDQCEGYGQYKCESSGITKSDGECCVCANRTSLDCPDGSEAGKCPYGCSSIEICVDFPGMCHKCVPKTESCPAGTAKGPCTPGICSSDQKCVAAGEICHTCQPKDCADLGHLTSCIICDVENHDCKEIHPRPDLTCYECINNPCSPNLNKDQCVTCEEQGGTCTPLIGPMQTRTRGTPECFKCVPKPPECPQGTAPGACTQSSCSSQEECVPAGENCHRCQKKKQSCEDMGMSDGDTCARTCKDGTCVQGRADDFETRCWECKKTSTQPQCDDGYQPGTCPGSCSPGQECTQAGQCHSCSSEYDDQECDSDDDCADALFCNGSEMCSQEKCAPGPLPCPEGQSCDETNDRCISSTSMPCVGGSSPGGCYPNPCYMGQLCHPDESGQCHTCIPMDTGPCVGQGMPGDCPGYCSAGEECIEVGEECHTCREKTRTQPLCGSGFIPGGCPGTCTANQNCVEPQWQAGCHYCEVKPVTEEGGGGGVTTGGGYGYVPGGSLGWNPGGGKTYWGGDLGGFGYIPGGGGQTSQTCESQNLLPNCYPCRWQGMECAPAGKGCFTCQRLDCGEDYRPASWCEDCEEDGGYCVPAPGEAMKPGGPKCFDCVDYEECEDYGLVCNCYACRPGSTCVAAQTIESEHGNKICYACMRNVTVEVTYVVIIIETPFVRYVLKDMPNMGGFNPSSVMALMKVDTQKLSQIKKLIDLAKGGIKGFSVGSIQEVAGMLEGLGKKKSFGSDCFSGFSEAPSAETPPSGGSGKKGDSAPPSFGKEEKQDAAVNGPVVACGKENGKDVLNIFDASGAKVTSLLKNELMGSGPNALLGGLSKAQQMSDQMTKLATMDPKSLAKQFASQLVEKIFAPRKIEKEGKPTNFDPNDPLFLTADGKPKSQVKERMKKVVGSVFDSAMGGPTVREKEGPDIPDQWGIRRVGYLPKSDPDSAWNVIDGEQKNVVVAVIDTGIDMTHPDGPQNIWMNSKEVPDNKIDDDNNGYVDDIYGWNFLNDTGDLTDPKGHGTFVAGIIAAKRNNGIGIAGINPGAVIMPLKVGNEEGETNSFNIYRAIMYAVNHGAQVINVSLGAQGISELEQKAIQYAESRGVFVAVAGGNVGEDIGNHGPASALGAFVVGAMDYDDKKSPISNWGANNGLIGPAEKIWSIRSKESYVPGRILSKYEFYYPQDGTSFSTPMVAATASLMLAKNPNLTPKQIEDVLHATADDMGRDGWDSDYGAGVLNASKALRQNPDGLLTAKVTRVRVNKDRNNKIESVDVFGTVRGEFSEFDVQLAKGKDGMAFKPVAGPFSQKAANDWLTRIDYNELKGSDEWIIRMAVTDKKGQPHTADSLLILEKKSGAEKHDDLYYGR